jgi:Carboxypeptidase regulatory-like domain
MVVAGKVKVYDLVHRGTKILIAGGLVAVGFAAITLWTSTSSASAQGIEGVVSDQAGPVAGAEVTLVPEDHSWAPHTTTGPGGSYTLTVPAGTYSVGVTPPLGSMDGYFEQSDVVVPSVGNVVRNALLPSSEEASGGLFGTASYSGNSTYAGVQVQVMTVTAGGQLSNLTSTTTDAAGYWNAGQIPAGTYYLVFVADVDNDNVTEATEYVAIGEGQQVSLSTVLTGSPPSSPGPSPPPSPAPTLAGTVTYASTGGPDPGAVITATPSGGSEKPTAISGDLEGNFSAALAPGTYSLTVSSTQHQLSSAMGSTSWWSSATPDVADLTTTVMVVEGQLTTANLVLPPLPVPAGGTANETSQDLEYLNAERTRWGLPAGILANPTWSQACAAHDDYLALNHLLEHPEDESKPGYSPGGNWAGTNSILSEGSAWSAEANPWEDAPLHLDQLMTPALTTVGIDGSDGYHCVTTWPGLPATIFPFLPLPTLAAPLGTVFTYPGNGTTGLPPAEDAAESPFVPGKFVGIPEGTIAGRELFVYEEGIQSGVSLASASLTGPGGPVQIKWVDGETPEVGGYLTGAIIIPVQPLAANTTYTADVTLNANSLAPEITHQWSFTTGAANPSGIWPGSTYGSASAPSVRRPLLARLKLTPSSFEAARSGATISRSRAGSTVTYSDSEAATTELEVLREAPGKSRGRSCVAPSRKLARARSCLRLVRVYEFSHRDKAGTNRLRFSGRAGHRALTAGAYELQARASLDGVRSPAVSTRFRIVK